MTGDQPYKLVRLEGIDISSDVRAVAVEDHDRLIDRAEIVMDDPSETTGEVPREGQTVLIDLGWGDAHAVIFEGAIVSVDVHAAGDARQTVTLTAYDLSYRLKRRPFAATNHVGALSSILNGLITKDAAAGIAIGQIEPETDPEFTDALPLRQTAQNDWDFIQHLAARYGCRAFVEYNGDASKFYFIPAARLLDGAPLGWLSYRGSTGRLIEIRYQRVAHAAAALRTTATSDPLSGAEVTAIAPVPAPEPAATPSATTRARAPGGGAQLDSALLVTGQAVGRPEDQRPQVFLTGLPSDAARAAAAAVQDPTNQLGLRADGVCVGAVQLRAKGKVELDGVAAWATGEWYVRTATHFVGQTPPGSGRPGYTTSFTLTR